MSDRRPDAILRDWRQAERDHQADDENPELGVRVTELRVEHRRAVDARREIARDLSGTSHDDEDEALESSAAAS